MQKNSLRTIFGCLIFVVFTVVALRASDAVAGEPVEDSNIVISEIKLGGSVSGQPTEFVEIYNNGTETVDIEGWIIERAKPDAEIIDCSSYPWIDQSGSSTAIKSYELSGGGTLSIEPGSTVVVEAQLNDAKSGAVRLIEPAAEESQAPTLQDLVVWGENAVCYQTAAAPVPENMESLQRLWDCDAERLIDSGVSSDDFTVRQQPNPGGLDENELSACDNDTPPGQDDDGEDDDRTSCQDVIISELLPNAEGGDNGNEFIELYNPTPGPINLADCALQLNGQETKVFGEVSLDPGQYMSFDDTKTGITLPNSAGGIIYLIDYNGLRLQSVEYAGGLDGDVSWAWFEDEGWQQTYSPTPGAANIKQPTKPCPEGEYRSEETGRCRSVGVGGSSELVPCNENQFRNPLTNRCKLKSSTGSDLKPCREDQFRNPETNRCKLKSSTGSDLKPCNPDQFRNPETNRCKKIDSGDSLKPCDEDEERNPETNRCRKVRGASTDDLAKIEDIEAPIVSGGYGWMLAGLTGGGVLAYAGWEWRKEIMSLLSKIKR